MTPNIQTHNVAMTKGLADFVVVLGPNGKVQSQGSMSKALAHDSKLAEAAEEQAQMDSKAENTANNGEEGARKAAGKLMVEEEVAVGHVGWDASELVVRPVITVPRSPRPVKFYLASLSGRHPWIFWVSFMGFLTISSSLDNFQVWFLGYWAQQYETHTPSDVRAP